jgi:hypothetical protein
LESKFRMKKTAITNEQTAIFKPLGLVNRELNRSTLQFDIFGLFIGKKQELEQELGLNRSASLRQHKAYRPNAILLVPPTPKGLHRKAAAPCHVWTPCPDNDLAELHSGTTV